MPNHVMNVVTFNGNNKKMQEILEDIKDDEIGYVGLLCALRRGIYLV